jgi:hypothetical protein
MAFERAEEGNLAVLEGEHRVALANFHAVLAGYGVNVLGIELQLVEGGEDLPWGRVRCAAQRGQKTSEGEQNPEKPHETSVDTFGIVEQGGEAPHVSGN